MNGAPPVGFKSLGDRTFLLAADDECDRIEQPCFVRARLAPASENQACQCQRQNGLNFQVSLPAQAIISLPLSPRGEKKEGGRCRLYWYTGWRTLAHKCPGPRPPRLMRLITSDTRARGAGGQVFPRNHRDQRRLHHDQRR